MSRPAATGSVLEIPLSEAAIADINAAAGGLFAVGVHVDQITLAFGDERAALEQRQRGKIPCMSY